MASALLAALTFAAPGWRQQFGLPGVVSGILFVVAGALAWTVLQHIGQWAVYAVHVMGAYDATFDRLERVEQQVREGELDLSRRGSEADQLATDLSQVTADSNELRVRLADLQRDRDSNVNENISLRETILRYSGAYSEYVIEEVQVRSGDVYLVLAKPAGRPIRIGRKLAILDKTDGTAFGLFAVTEVKRTTYYLRQVGTVSAVWLGYLQGLANPAGIKPPANAAAFLLPEEE